MAEALVGYMSCDMARLMERLPAEEAVRFASRPGRNV